MGRRGNFILAGSRETIIFPLCVKGSLLKRSEAPTELFSLTITPGLLLSEFSHPNRNTPKRNANKVHFFKFFFLFILKPLLNRMNKIQSLRSSFLILYRTFFKLKTLILPANRGKNATVISSSPSYFTCIF